MTTDWPSYKELCDRPNVLSRWMLTETASLLEPPLRQRLLAQLATPLPKPADHRGGPDTDMFEVALSEADAHGVRLAVERAVQAGTRSPGTQSRGLGGFVEAWRELEERQNAFGPIRQI